MNKNWSTCAKTEAQYMSNEGMLDGCQIITHVVDGIDISSENYRNTDTDDRADAGSDMSGLP